MLPEFQLVIPESLPEALGALAESAPDVAPWGGGTNLLVDMRSGRYRVGNVVGLDRLDGLDEIQQRDGWVSIGARVTLADLLREPSMERVGPSLLESARAFAGAPIRNLATVAGNVAYASPAGDAIPPLLALGAEVVMRKNGDTRTVPLEELFLGVRRTVREPDELITGIRWPLPPAGSTEAFYKLGLRRGDAISVVCVAVQLTPGEDGSCRSGRIALGAVAPTCIRAYEAEEALRGEVLSESLIDQVAQKAMGACSPIDDVRGSAEYRRRMVRVLVRRLLTRAWDEMKAGEGS
jgi:carbon-monoxide dehydrogenase medium subunit